MRHRSSAARLKTLMPSSDSNSSPKHPLPPTPPTPPTHLFLHAPPQQCGQAQVLVFLRAQQVLDGQVLLLVQGTLLCRQLLRGRL